MERKPDLTRYIWERKPDLTRYIWERKPDLTRYVWERKHRFKQIYLGEKTQILPGIFG